MAMAMSASAPALSGAGMAMTGGATGGLSSTFGMSKAAIREKHPKIWEAAKHPKLHPRGFFGSKKTSAEFMADTCSETTSTFFVLEQGLRDLEMNIGNDRKSLKEMNRQQEAMQAEVDRLKRQIDVEEAWVNGMSSGSLGTAMKDFDRFMGDVHRSYGKVREGHKHNINILKTEFGYNPAFKKGGSGNEFSGAYFAMHPAPAKKHPGT